MGKMAVNNILRQIVNERHEPFRSHICNQTYPKVRCAFSNLFQPDQTDFKQSQTFHIICRITNEMQGGEI